MKTEIYEATVGVKHAESLVRKVQTAMREGKVDRAVNQFGEQFAFNDYGIGLAFRDKWRLAEFFRKTRELYPDSSLLTNTIFVCGDDVISEWTLRVRLTEPFFGGSSRRVAISLPGVSVVRIENGDITRWSEYYDGRTSRRTALASYFTDWVEI